jgi:hypothetical protein
LDYSSDKFWADHMTVPFPDITDDLKKTLETFTAEYNAMGHKNTKVESIK